MRLLLLVGFFIVCWSSTANAQIVKVVSQTCVNGSCVRDYATGTVVAQENGLSYVLTVGHVVRTAQYVWVGEQPAKIAGYADRNGIDLAMLTASNISVVSSLMPVSKQELSTGLSVSVTKSGSETYTLSSENPGWLRQLGPVDRSMLSGSPVHHDRTQYGVVSGITNDHKIRYTPATTVFAFCQQFCVPCRNQAPPIMGSLHLLPRKPQGVPPPPDTGKDVPDAEKTTRIRNLESDVRALKSLLSELQAAKVLVPSEKGERGSDGKQGPPGEAGPPGPAGSFSGSFEIYTKDSQGTESVLQTGVVKSGAPLRIYIPPNRVKIISVAPDGTETVIASEVFRPDTPIKLRFYEKWLQSQAQSGE